MTKHLLHVSEEDRESWVPQVPKEICKAERDTVSFTTTEPNPSVDGVNAACYASLNPNYDKWDITCIPRHSKGVISSEDAFTFFNVFTDAGVIPEGVQLWEEDGGTRCRIPAGCGNPHNVYATLTCYRWLDSRPPLVWEFLRIMEKGNHLHPLQILPYLASKHSPGSGHSFINAQIGGGAVTDALNPVLGLAVKIYFDKGDERGRKEYETPGNYVNSTITNIAKELCAGFTTSPAAGGWRNPSTLKYALEKPEDALHPGLTDMYTIPNITPKQVKEFLKDLFTKEKK